MNIVLIIVGILFLYFGAEGLIKGASALALNRGVSSLVVGLTIVAFGTSLPELVSSLIAQIKNPDGVIAFSNIIGSNIANMGLILGIALCLRSLQIDKFACREAKIMGGVSLGAVCFFYNLIITRWIALFFLGGIVIYLYAHWRQHRENVAISENTKTHLGLNQEVLLILFGIVGVAFGGYCLIEGAILLARDLGMSERIIGLCIVALGTSLPELVTSLVALYRREEALLLGNILGSNLLNLLLIPGVVALFYPMRIPKEFWIIDVWVLLGISLLLVALILQVKKKIPRVWGGIFLLSYSTYIYSLF